MISTGNRDCQRKMQGTVHVVEAQPTNAYIQTIPSAEQGYAVRIALVLFLFFFF